MGKTEKASERLYRTLLRAYPREFRDEYGAEMSLFFRDRARDGLAGLWLGVLRDLIVHAPHQHWGMLKQDVGDALRSWRLSPAVPAMAITALTLGMGATISVFSVLYAVLLRPLPVPEPDRILQVWETNSAGISGVSLPNYLSWRERARGVELAAVSGQTLTWTDGQYPERLDALAPTASLLAVIGVPPLHGRWFTVNDERRGQHRVAVISHRLWRARFGADPGIVGRQLMLNGAPYSVIGVASPNFVVPSEPDLWVPQVVDPAAERGNRYLTVIGRLKPGVTVQQGESELIAVALALAQAFPKSNQGYRVSAAGFADSLVPDDVRTALKLLLAATAMVLLIACANVAHVLLSRAVARGREIVIRAALGAGTARLARQLVTEGLLLSLTAGLLGLLVSAAIAAGARRMLAGIVPRVEAVALDLPVLGFALGLALVTGVACTLAPLRRVAHMRPRDLSHAIVRQPIVSARLRTMLVVAQVTLTTLLLMTTGLLIQSVTNLKRAPIGFDPDSVITARLSLTRARLPDGVAIDAFLSRLSRDLDDTPGIAAAGVSSAIPLSPGAMTVTQIATATGSLVTTEWRLVNSGYFRTLRIPLLGGRLFTPEDRAGAPPVFVISQSAARGLYGAANPIGQPLRLDGGRTGEVVGVVADVQMRRLGGPPERVVYMPPAQFGFFPRFDLVLRADGSAETAAAAIRDRLQDHDPQMAAHDIQRMQHWIDQSTLLTRVRAGLMTLLGATALLLGVVGIYGIIAHTVAQRTREFGVRVALGEQPAALAIALMTNTLRQASAGIAIGAIGAVVTGRWIRHLLYEVPVWDPATLVSVSVLVLLVAVAASYVPARRAASTDPLTVLRVE